MNSNTNIRLFEKHFFQELTSKAGNFQGKHLTNNHTGNEIMSGENILLLDTEKNVLFTYKNALEEEGYHIDFADNEYDALDKISQISFSMVITEFHLRGSNALDLIKSIKENKPAVQVIVLTASTLSFPAYEALHEAGILDCLMKPFPIARLLIIIKKGLKKSGFIAEKIIVENKLHAIESYMLNPGSQMSDNLYFLKTLRNEIKRSERFNHSLSLLSIKIPLLSNAGQSCEEQIAGIALSTVRGTDTVTRFNGICSIILPETAKTGVTALTERIRKKISEHVEQMKSSHMRSVAEELDFTCGCFPDDMSFINQSIETLHERVQPVTLETSSESQRSPLR